MYLYLSLVHDISWYMANAVYHLICMLCKGEPGLNIEDSVVLSRSGHFMHQFTELCTKFFILSSTRSLCMCV